MVLFDKMHTLGSDFLPPANHSGGLRYHGMSYHLSHLYELGLMRAKAYGQKDCFEAGLTFAKQEGIIPAPEGNHAIKGAIDAALECKEKGEAKTILFNLCGHGYFDMSAYDDYLNGSMADDVIDDDGIGKSISQIPEVA
jgi:tryptophan synthase beta chain